MALLEALFPLRWGSEVMLALRNRRVTAALLVLGSAVFAVYVLGVAIRVLSVELSTVLAFSVFEVSLAALALGASRSEHTMKRRLLVYWVSTASVALSASAPAYIPPMFAGLGLWAILAAWVASGVAAIGADVRTDKGDRHLWARVLFESGAMILAASLMLQIGVPPLKPLLEASVPGKAFLTIAASWASLIPVRTIIALVALSGLFVEVAALYADSPYEPRNPDDLFPARGEAWRVVLIQVARWPVWLAVVVVEFASRVAYLLAQALMKLGKDWLARATYAALALVGSVLLLALSHFFLWDAAHAVVLRTLGQVPFAFGALYIHAFALLTLCFLTLAPATAAIRSDVMRAQLGSSRLLHYLRSTGGVIAQETGRAFAVVGVAFVAVPLAAAIPGGSDFGGISALYVSVVALGGLVAVAKRASG